MTAFAANGTDLRSLFAIRAEQDGGDVLHGFIGHNPSVAKALEPVIAQGNQVRDRAVNLRNGLAEKRAKIDADSNLSEQGRAQQRSKIAAEAHAEVRKIINDATATLSAAPSLHAARRSSALSVKPDPAHAEVRGLLLNRPAAERRAAAGELVGAILVDQDLTAAEALLSASPVVRRQLLSGHEQRLLEDLLVSSRYPDAEAGAIASQLAEGIAEDLDTFARELAEAAGLAHEPVDLKLVPVSPTASFEQAAAHDRMADVQRRVDEARGIRSNDHGTEEAREGAA